MSLTTSTCQEIFNSPLNDSMTKQLYSFSKSPRFDKLENNSYCTQAYYQLPQTMSHRGTSLGYGNKYELGGKLGAKSPGPCSYRIKGEFEQAQETKKGFIFGVGREKMTQQSILGQVNSENPGPGKYDAPSSLSNVRYTLRTKPDDSLLNKHRVVPGPGTYQSLPALTEKGIYPISKFRNSGACIINPNGNRFVDDYATLAPGPGQYSLDKTSLQKVSFNLHATQDGQYFINKFKSSSQNSFPHQKRVTGTFENYEKTPGPGSYKLPSDFGHYEARPKPPLHIFQ